MAKNWDTEPIVAWSLCHCAHTSWTDYSGKWVCSKTVQIVKNCSSIVQLACFLNEIHTNTVLSYLNDLSSKLVEYYGLAN